MDVEFRVCVRRQLSLLYEGRDPAQFPRFVVEEYEYACAEHL